MLVVRLLGSFEIKSGEKPVEIVSRPAQSLFAYLILNAGTAFRREKLAGQLWPDATEESARDYLRHALWRIRRALQEVSAASYLKADDLTISFVASRDYWLDAAALSGLDGKASADEIAEVLDAYAGELLPGFYDEWVTLARAHLQSIYEQQVSHLLEALQHQARWSDILHHAERWIALGQRPEAAYRHLMSAYAAQGDMAKAAAAYERCVKSLAELGVEPSDQTRRLYADLKAGRTQVQPVSPSATQPASQRRPSNLPAPLTSFIGREKELAEILRLLKSRRLLTLLGPGGVGKTRLAIAAANQLLSRFKDGVYWIDLVGLSEPSLVPQMVLQGAGVPEISNQPAMQTLVDDFASRQSLLIFDNCEHLITACAQLADHLLAHCRKLRILATSREAMDILGETTWTVPSLSLPETAHHPDAKSLARVESVRLFLERVASARSRFDLTNANAGAIVQICTRLGGIPLAIELAAARARMMSVEEIAERLDHAFDLLTGGNRAALPRHQTLRATIDWSYQLLSEPERVLFRRLAIFADGFTLEAVEAVTCDDLLPRPRIVELLGHLVGKSLVSALTGTEESETRYRMLETIRQYARERLETAGEFRILKERHLAFFADFALRAERGIYSDEQASWYTRLDLEADNLRAALDWSALPDQQQLLPSVRKNQFTIICAPLMYWERGYRHEIAQVAKKLLELDRVNQPTVERARALYAAGFLCWSLYDFSFTRSCLEESIAISESLGDPLTLAWALGYLGWTLDSLGEYEQAQGLLERAVAVARTLGDAGDQAAASSMSFLGDIPYWRGDLVAARRLYEEAIGSTRKIHNINMMTYPLRRLGYVALRQGKPEEAASLFAECLLYNQQLNHVPGMTACIAGFAAIRLAKHEYQEAALLCGCVEILLERFGAPFFMVDMVEFERTLASLKEKLNGTPFQEAWRVGHSMQLSQAIDHVLDGDREHRLPRQSRKAAKRHMQNTRTKHA